MDTNWSGAAISDMHESWQLGASGPEAYESFLVPQLFRPWAERLVALANPQPGEQVLDVGCGTGIVARLAAARVGSSGRIIGVDLSPDMLAVAREVSGS